MVSDLEKPLLPLLMTLNLPLKKKLEETKELPKKNTKEKILISGLSLMKMVY